MAAVRNSHRFSHASAIIGVGILTADRTFWRV
jgi:hypothetical protein